MDGRTLALAATSLGFGVVQLDVSVVNVAIEPIRADFGGPVSGIQWVVSAYTVAFAALILSAGALGDRLGAKRVFAGGFGVFTVASVACGLAPSLGVLIGARVVQGVGAAALVPCSLTVLNHAYPVAADRARAIGIWSAGASVGLAGGPLLGGVLTEALDWRWIFFINLPLGVLGIVLTLRYAQETTRSSERPLDLPGQVLAVGTLALVAAASIGGGSRGFTSAPVLGAFALALLGGVGFVVVEGRRRSPMLPLGLFRSPVFSVATAIGLLINVGVYGLIFVLSLWFQSTRGYSALGTGFAFVPMTGVVLFVNLAAGSLADRFGPRTVVVTGALVMALALAGLLVLGPRAPYGALVVPLIGVGAGLAAIIPVITSAQLGSVDRSRSGIAAGTLNTARQAGSVVGVALFGSFAAVDVTGGLHRSLLVACGLALTAALLGTRLVATRAASGSPAVTR